MTWSVKAVRLHASSSVSDGVQSLITEKFPGTISARSRTSGDGAVHFQTRVQYVPVKASKARRPTSRLR